MLDGENTLCEMNSLCSDASQVAAILGDPGCVTNRSTKQTIKAINRHLYPSLDELLCEVTAETALL